MSYKFEISPSAPLRIKVQRKLLTLHTAYRVLMYPVACTYRIFYIPYSILPNHQIASHSMYENPPRKLLAGTLCYHMRHRRLTLPGRTYNTINLMALFRSVARSESWPFFRFLLKVYNPAKFCLSSTFLFSAFRHCMRQEGGFIEGYSTSCGLSIYVVPILTERLSLCRFACCTPFHPRWICVNRFSTQMYQIIFRFQFLFFVWLVQDLQSEIETHRVVYDRLDGTGRKLLGSLTSQEDAVMLQRRLDEMNHRWNHLKSKSIAIR